MHQFFLLLMLGVAFINAEEDDSFSIGLGVLSPSYSQTVGKENVKVKFDQKENGQFSYSVGDPKSGTNTFLNFGPSAGRQVAPAGYAEPAAPERAYQAPSYGGPSSARDPQTVLPAGFSYHATEGQAFLRGPELRKPEDDPSQIVPAGFSYHGTEGQAFLRQQELRKPAETPSQVLPDGCSYHATEGQSFIRQGGSPNFVIDEEKQSSPRGPAEQSFFKNFQSSSQSGGRGLVNGLVGYGPGGPARGNLPIGGYAGPQFSGGFKEHGGHE